MVSKLQYSRAHQLDLHLSSEGDVDQRLVTSLIWI